MVLQNNSLAIQIGDGATVQLDTTPLVQAFESVFANVPGIEELLRPLVAAPNTAPPTNAPPTNANLTTAPPNSAPPLPTASTQPGANRQIKPPVSVALGQEVLL